MVPFLPSGLTNVPSHSIFANVSRAKGIPACCFLGHCIDYLCAPRYNVVSQTSTPMAHVGRMKTFLAQLHGMKNCKPWCPEKSLVIDTLRY